MPEGEGLPPAAERGTLVIADRVVAGIARIAAQEVRGTVVIGGRKSLPRTKATVASRRTRLSVQIAVEWPYQLSAVGGAVRDLVVERVTRLTGLAVDGIEVTIASVVTPDDLEVERSVR